MAEWILIAGSQIFLTILLFSIGLINRRERWLTKAMLVVAVVFLILLSIWGFYTSSREFGDALNSKVFEMLLFRIYAFIEIIIAALSLYACK